MKKLVFAMGLLLCVQLYGTDNWKSESAHAVGGAVMAGAITALTDYYYPEYADDRAMIGFGISSTVIIAEQYYEYRKSGNGRGQALDALSHIVGSAIGAYATDRFILSPDVHTSSAEGEYVGIRLYARF